MMNIPNALTLLRIILIPVFVYFLLDRQFVEALIVFALGSITDGLDGFLARKMDQITMLGKFLDPMADKLFLLASYTASYFVNILPLWLLIIVFLKEIIMLSGLLALYLSVKKVQIKPTLSGKMTTAFQMITILLILVSGMGVGHEWILFFAFVATSVLMLISTTGYVIIGIKAYREAH